MKLDDKTSIISKTINIGVDVSKAKLDIFVPATKEGVQPTIMEVENKHDGFKKLRILARKNNATVCVEPTGGYELELIAFMHKSNVKVAYADAFRVRQFAKAEGNYSKNDRIDAALISRFADKIGVRVLDKQDFESVELRRQTKFRQTLIDQRTIFRNLLETEFDKDMKLYIENEIKHLDKMIKKVEHKCLQTVAQNPQKDSLRKRFTEVGGVADITAIAVIAGLPEIGTLPDAKLNRLVGIAPEEKQSGTQKGQNKIWGGRKYVRNAIFMATISSLIWNHKLSTYYKKKRAEGHPHKWAIVPTMRKLLSLLNHIARDPNFKPEPEPKQTKENAPGGRRKKVVD